MKTTAVLISLAYVSLALAALPDDVVRECMEQSPEIAEVEILVVERSTPVAETGEQEVTITAKILAVKKSSSGLSPDQVVRVVYKAFAPGSFPPPGTHPTVPSLGQRLMAYLTQVPGEDSYMPTPSTYGFSEVSS